MQEQTVKNAAYWCVRASYYASRKFHADLTNIKEQKKDSEKYTNICQNIAGLTNPHKTAHGKNSGGGRKAESTAEVMAADTHNTCEKYRKNRKTE